MKDANCIFCKIINGDIPSRRIYEDENFVVMMDVSPASKGHSLLLPKEHYANLFEMPDALLEELLKVAKKVAAQMKESLQADGINLLQNNGVAAGQTVFHYHMHLIPRYEGEEPILTWEPKSYSAEEMDEIKSTILK